MYLEHLEIKNFMGLNDNLVFQAAPGWYPIMGRKTTTLRALAILSLGDPDIHTLVVSPDNMVTSDKNNARISASGNDLQWSLDIHKKKSTDFMFESNTEAYPTNERYPTNAGYGFNAWWNPMALHMRSNDQGYYEGSQHRFNRHQSMFRANDSLLDMLIRWLPHLYYVSLEGDNSKQVLLQQIIEFINNGQSEKIYRPSSDRHSPVIMGDENYSYSIHKTGTRYIYQFMIVMDLIKRSIDQKEDWKNIQGTVLIDDAHMVNPDWLCWRFPKIQFIVSGE